MTSVAPLQTPPSQRTKRTRSGSRRGSPSRQQTGKMAPTCSNSLPRRQARTRYACVSHTTRLDVHATTSYSSFDNHAGGRAGWQVRVAVNGVDIAGSPFEITLIGASPDLSSARLEGTALGGTLICGQPAVTLIHFCDQFGNPVKPSRSAFQPGMAMVSDASSADGSSQHVCWALPVLCGCC